MKNIKKKIVLSIGVILILTSILGIAAAPVIAHTEDTPFVADLIAGGGNEKSAIDVGDVLVWNDADFLYVKYSLDDGWCLTETHLHVTTSLEEIPQTKKGNPIPGHFEYKEEHNGLISFTYEIPMSWGIDTKIYIAAHADVKRIIGFETPNMDDFSQTLPEQVIMSVQYSYEGAPSYFPVTTITGDPLTGEYEGWCVDTDNTISQGVDYTANVFSSYEMLLDGLVEYPENLDLVNWIINQDYVGKDSTCCGVYTYGDVQRAIWTLIEDEQSDAGLGLWSECRVDEVLSAADANGEGFVPGCGDLVVVIIVPFGEYIDSQQIIIAQVSFIDVGLECTLIYGQSETAWGAHEYGIEGFPGKNWATYFTYTIQGWNLIGDWTLRFIFGGNWDHDMTITTQDNYGNIEGYGGFPSGKEYTHFWTMTGKVSGNVIEFTIIYSPESQNPGYTVMATGIIEEDGSMSGTWSSANQVGNWMSLSGSAI